MGNNPFKTCHNCWTNFEKNRKYQNFCEISDLLSLVISRHLQCGKTPLKCCHDLSLTIWLALRHFKERKISHIYWKFQKYQIGLKSYAIFVGDTFSLVTAHDRPNKKNSL